jgi:hypothetical protein
MKKTFTLALLVCLMHTANAQFFVEVGANAQVLNLQVKESPALGAVSELIKMGGGISTTVLPKRIQSRSIAPKISIGYRIPFDDFNLLLSAGTSQDMGNSFRLRGSAAVGGKTYPYPESFSIRARAYKTLENTGLSFGGELCFDNQKSEMLLASSNLDPKVIGLLNQIGSDMNLLGSGSTRNMQMNALIGWQKTHNEFEVGVFALAGIVGKSFGAQLDMKVRYFFGER